MVSEPYQPNLFADDFTALSKCSMKREHTNPMIYVQFICPQRRKYHLNGSKQVGPEELALIIAELEGHTSKHPRHKNSREESNFPGYGRLYHS